VLTVLERKCSPPSAINSLPELYIYGSAKMNYERPDWTVFQTILEALLSTSKNWGDFCHSIIGTQLFMVVFYLKCGPGFQNNWYL